MNKLFTTTIMFVCLLGCNSNGVLGDPQTVWVNPYTRSDGTYIYGHYRNVFSDSDKQYCCSDRRGYYIKISSDSISLNCSSSNIVERFAAEEAILDCKNILTSAGYSGKNMSDKEANNFLQKALQKKNCKYSVSYGVDMKCSI